MQDALALFGERFEADEEVMDHVDTDAPPKFEKANTVPEPSIPGLAIPGLKLPGLF